jgi:hypothetical protein
MVLVDKAKGHRVFGPYGVSAGGNLMSNVETGSSDLARTTKFSLCDTGMSSSQHRGQTTKQRNLQKPSTTAGIWAGIDCSVNEI